MLIVVDSSIWVSLLDQDDSQHKKAKSFFTDHKEETIIVTEYIVLEVSTILEQHVGKQAADLFIEKTCQNSSVQFRPSSPSFFSEIILFYLKDHHKHLSFVDVSLLYLSRLHPIYTFDKKLANAIKNRK